MKKFLAAALSGLVGAAVFLVPTPAHAASATSVTSPSCGTIKVTNTATWSESQYVTSDNDAFISILPKGQSEVTREVPAGTYAWQAHGDDYDRGYEAYGRVTVAPCNSTWPKRRTPGDQNGDGRSDVLGIQASTGNLYYYRMTTTGLANGIQAGSGWNRMTFMQQVDGIVVAGSWQPANYLFAVRNDGTVWRYPNKGQGRFGNGVQVGSGFSGWSNFTVLPENNRILWGVPMLLASDGQRLHAFPIGDGTVTDALEVNEDWSDVVKTIGMRDFDGDSVADVVTVNSGGAMHLWAANLDFATDTVRQVRQIGSSWSAMGIVSSPGTLNGDWNSDLIARRSDGNLYKYINAGGRWSAGQKIGSNWNRIRILA